MKLSQENVCVTVMRFIEACLGKSSQKGGFTGACTRAQ